MEENIIEDIARELGYSEVMQKACYDCGYRYKMTMINGTSVIFTEARVINKDWIWIDSDDAEWRGRDVAVKYIMFIEDAES